MTESKTHCAICGKLVLRPPAPVFGDRSPYHLRHCDFCGVEWIEPMPNEAELKKFYQNYPISDLDWERFTWLIEHSGPAVRRMIEYVSRYGTSGGRRFIDIGGASGFLAAAVASHGMQSTSQDISENSGQWLERWGAEKGKRVLRVIAPLDKFPALEMGYDLINTSQVLEHQIEPWRFLRAIGQLARPGALLFLDTPNNLGFVWRIKNIVRKRFNREDFWNTLRPIEHLWGHTPKSMARLLEISGYEVLDVKDYGLGDRKYQPAAGEWYPGFKEVSCQLLHKQADVYILGKQVAAILDRAIFSRFFHRGGSLSAVARWRGLEFGEMAERPNATAC